MNARPILLAAALSVAAAAHANVDLKVTAICPTSVSYGTGDTTLSVGIDLVNGSWQDEIVIRRYAATMIANVSGTLAGMSVYGPFPKIRSRLILPPWINYPPTPVSIEVPALKVPDAVGTMALVHIEFLSDEGHEQGGDDCWVRIVP